MFLQKLSLLNFKNYKEAEFSFSPLVNCFVGNNGVGKTNLLEAIHYLSFCKSFNNPIDSQNILHEAPFLVIQGDFQRLEKEESLYCGIKRGQKKQFRRNKKDYKRLADHIGLFPLVMISPEDSTLINEGSEIRRKFTDRIISQYDKTYLEALIRYNKALLQRNALLKQFAESGNFDAVSLEVWDVQLAESGAKIHACRSRFIQDFIPVFQHYFDKISNAKEKVELAYDSQLNQADFSTLLKERVRKDRIVQHTTAGTHKDDLEFKLDKYSIKKFGSQGQQKSYLIALRLAQYKYIREKTGLAPLLLLDDVFDKLDESRVKALMQLVSENEFGQIFITHTHSQRISDIFNEIGAEIKIFRIQDGSCKVKS